MTTPIDYRDYQMTISAHPNCYGHAATEESSERDALEITRRLESRFPGLRITVTGNEIENLRGPDEDVCDEITCVWGKIFTDLMSS